MSELRSTRDILAEAERAASTGDFLSAETLLRDAVARQEAELGPVHPDLANTVNNLAVAAERSGRLEDAETFYRRAVAIASASLQPDDPKLAASRQNLEDFCRAYGRPLDRSRAIEPPADAPALPTPTAPAPLQPVSPKPPAPVSLKRSRPPAALPIGVVGLIIFATVMAWLLSPRHPSTIVPAAGRSTAKAATPAPSSPAVAPADRTPAPTVARTQAAAPTPGAVQTAAIQLVTVQLCRSFSSETFRCNPAGDSVPAGTIVLYTRIRSPQDGFVVHRWFRGDALRKTSRLRIGANEAEGYRTFSQESVDRGEWRVEVRSAAGDLLYEHRLAVR
jgi:hypothetical protein